MNLAVLYVCTGRYIHFWDAFYHSAEQYFLSGYEKHYYVFTDGVLAHSENPRVHRIEQKDLGWPDNTLLRYHMFARIAACLKQHEFCYFFNGNTEFCAPVGEEFFPAEGKMLFVQHPGYYNKACESLPYERNIHSRACIAPQEGAVYVCGGVNGGRTDTYLFFIRTIMAAVDVDKARNLQAVWHDESHSNRFAIDHPHIMLEPGYCYPEGWALPFAPKVRILDKAQHGGHAYLRGETATPVPSNPQRVSTQLMGGLGNQMFQYAAGRALAFRLNSELVLDVSWFAADKVDLARAYSLNVFPQLQGRLATQEEYQVLRYPLVQQKLWWRFVRRIMHFFRRFMYLPFQYVREENVPNRIDFCELQGECALSGYWQNEDYFSDAEWHIRKEFTFPSLPANAAGLAQRIFSVSNATAVHVRRGDYITNSAANAFHGVCTLTYYAAALSYIKKNVHDVTLFIFSDDPAWVRENFDIASLPAVVVDLHDENEAHHDMHLMSLCKHHIIANSSFSWWGAWLANGNGITIAPKQWFKDPSVQHKNPCPARWISM